MTLLPTLPPERVTMVVPGSMQRVLGGTDGPSPMGRAWRAWGLGLGAVLVLVLAACGPKEAPPEVVRAVRTQVLQAELASQPVRYAGEVRARVESRLAFQVPGKVVARKVGLGERVRKGQVLMQLDPKDLQLGVDASRAQLRAAKVQRDVQLAELKRFRGLRDQGFISGAEMERREAAYQGAQAQFEQARAGARGQARQLAHGVLQADAAGVITAVDADTGTVVAAGQPVLRLAQAGPKDVVFQVPEHRVADFRRRAQIGLRVRVGEGGESMEATVREVAESADPVTRTFLVKADLGPAEGVKLGQTATVELPPTQSAVGLVLPLSAVFESGGQAKVWVLDGATQRVRAQAVQIARTEGNRVLVGAGLTPQQEVVVAGTHVLQEGQKVRRYTEGAAGSGGTAASAAPVASVTGAASAPAVVPAASR